MKIDFIDLGRIDYETAWEVQKETLQKRVDNEIPDTVIFCEHESVITLGRKSKRNPPILDPSLNLKVIEIERGGEATYHGPGQIVAYPIFRLSPKSESLCPEGLIGFIRSLEDIVSELVRAEGLTVDCTGKETGVWIDNQRKIASIGVAVKKWVTYHGLALNFNVDKKMWMAFNPCGFSGDVMTSLNTETKKEHSYLELKTKLENFFINKFSSYA